MKVTTIGIALALVLATSARAAEGAVTGEALPPRNALQLDLGLAVVGVGYERFVTSRIAIQVEAHIFGTWFMRPYAAGVGGQLRPTWFPLEDGGRGLYVAPFFRYERINRYNGVDTLGTSWSAGAWAGWSWVLFEALNLRLGAGAQYFTVSVPDEPSFATALPALDAIVGWMF